MPNKNPIVISYPEGDSAQPIERATLQMAAGDLIHYKRNELGLYDCYSGKDKIERNVSELAVYEEIKYFSSKYKDSDKAFVIRDSALAKGGDEKDFATLDKLVDSKVNSLKHSYSAEHSIHEFKEIVTKMNALTEPGNNKGLDAIEFTQLDKLAEDYGLKLKVKNLNGDKDQVEISSGHETVKVNITHVSSNFHYNNITVDDSNRGR